MPRAKRQILARADVRRESRGFEDHRDHQGPLEYQGKAFRDQKENEDPKVPQGNKESEDYLVSIT